MGDSAIALGGKLPSMLGPDYHESIILWERQASYIKSPCEWGHLKSGYSIGVTWISHPSWCHLEQRQAPLALAQTAELWSDKKKVIDVLSP